MLRTAVRSMWAHKLRLTLTALSVVLGVAFVVGSFVFTDTIGDGFNKLFGDAYAGVDVQVEAAFSDFAQEAETVPSFNEGVLDQIASVPGVGVAVPSVSGFAQLLDSEGRLLGITGPPKFAYSWVEDPLVNRLTILEGDGRPPTEPGEVVVDITTAETYDITLGQEVDVAFENGKGRFRVVGLATSVTQTDFGASSILLFEHREAQRLLGLENEITAIVIQAEDGLDPQVLLERIEAVLPEGLTASTGEQLEQSVLEELEAGLGFFNTALLVFAGVAILVGAFIIQNTFRIIVAQRLRELALLRAIGATSRQIVRMVATEAALVGVVSSAVGVGAGILLAYGMREALGLVGFSFPRGDLVVGTRTIVLGMVVGSGDHGDLGPSARLQGLLRAAGGGASCGRRPHQAGLASQPGHHRIVGHRAGSGGPGGGPGMAGNHLGGDRRSSPVLGSGDSGAPGGSSGRFLSGLAAAPTVRPAGSAGQGEHPPSAPPHGRHRLGADDRDCSGLFCGGALQFHQQIGGTVSAGDFRGRSDHHLGQLHHRSER